MSKPLPYIIRNPNGRLYFRRRYPAKDRRANPNLPEAFQYLIASDQVMLSPHVAGWTVESKIKLAQTVVDKIKVKFESYNEVQS